MPLLILMGAALLGAIISGAIGMGGGILLLAVMASLLDPALVVPVHGIVQLVSNSTRSLRLLGRVKGIFVWLYVPTLFVGAFTGLRFYAGASASWFRPFVGAFVAAFLLWDLLKPKRIMLPVWVLAPAGFVGGILTVLVGATGPYLAAFFLRDDLDREEIVATKAAIQTITHLVKIPVFLFVGFRYAEQLRLITPLVLCAVLGTLAGTTLLKRMNERFFSAAFRMVLAILAARLLLQGFVP